MFKCNFLCSFYLLKSISNIYSTVKDIVSANGYSGLWRGTVPTIMR